MARRTDRSALVVLGAVLFAGCMGLLTLGSRKPSAAGRAATRGCLSMSSQGDEEPELDEDGATPRGSKDEVPPGEPLGEGFLTPHAYPMIALSQGEGALAWGKVEVDRALWRSVSSQPPGDPACLEAAGLDPYRPDLPVTCVSGSEAIAFANALSEAEGYAPAYTVDGDTIHVDPTVEAYRLPTAEELAALEPLDALDPTALCARANVLDRQTGEDGSFGCGDGEASLLPAQRALRTRHSLRGVLGNATEWTSSLDPDGGRISLGLSYRMGPDRLAEGGRQLRADEDRAADLGFRLVRPVPPSAPEAAPQD